jgi:predicted secreted Zn-dependent protease
MRALPHPPEIQGDPKATEMIRVWLANGEVHVSLLLGMWADSATAGVDEREAWGQLLADVSRHVANGLHQSHGVDPTETTKVIEKSFLRHIRNRERTVEGTYVEDEGTAN